MGGSRNEKRKKEPTPTNQNKKINKKADETPKTSKKQKTGTETPLMKEMASQIDSTSTPLVQQVETQLPHSQPLNFSESQQAASSPVPPATPMTSQSAPELQTIEPPWVKTIMLKLDDISSSMCEIKQRVSHLESEICSLRQLNNKVVDMEEGIQFINTTLENFKREAKSNNDECRSTRRQVLHHEKEININKTKLMDLENRMMRDNLVFTGVPEQPNEDTEKPVTNKISQKMGITRQIQFERVHRMGKKEAENRRPRAVVAKFTYYKDREMVRKTSNRLKGTRIGVHEQFGQETAEKRRKLMPKMKEAREKGQYAQLVADTLIIDNEKFRVDAKGNIVKDLLYDRPPPPRKAPNTATPSQQEQPALNQHTDYLSVAQCPPLAASSPVNFK